MVTMAASLLETRQALFYSLSGMRVRCGAAVAAVDGRCACLLHALLTAAVVMSCSLLLYSGVRVVLVLHLAAPRFEWILSEL